MFEEALANRGSNSGGLNATCRVRRISHPWKQASNLTRNDKTTAKRLSLVVKKTAHNPQDPRFESPP
ncbi:hypothetical protein VNO77_44827 [Canavalia gladiata]|uniref:Uncharacterized protein n=1 Tax=Canavalia gladiata TaxID=3824 RepID=A0AAN9JXE2_CANGL